MGGSLILFVIEGIDLTGKTTLVNSLNRRLGGVSTVIHAEKPRQHPLLEYETTLEDYTPFLKNVILDRWHVGERVWPGVFGRTTEYDYAMHRHVELFLRSRGAVLVLAEAREEAIIQRLKSREEAIRPEQVSDILRTFKVIVKNETVLPFISYDFERNDTEQFVTTLIAQAAEQQQAVAAAHAVTRAWIGDPWPNVLYVGEQFGPGTDGKVKDGVIPFMPFKNTSGWYLLRALPLGRAALVNALQYDGTPELLDELWVVMGSPHVVALGNQAAEALKRLHVPHGIVPHPQYVRRFHAQAVITGKYHDMLKQAGDELVDTRRELASVR